MADNAWNCSAFNKMFDTGNNPFVKMMGEMNMPFSESMKQMAAQSLESSEKWASRAFEMNEKATEWAKDTPFASIFETQRSFARQMFDSSAALTRQLWQLEPKAEEAATEASN